MYMISSALPLPEVTVCGIVTCTIITIGTNNPGELKRKLVEDEVIVIPILFSVLTRT
jgi:hypothetical protein